MTSWVTKEVDDRIAQMADSLRRFRYRSASRPRPFVTISREFGCDSFEVAKGLVGRLNDIDRGDTGWDIYDRGLVEKVAGDYSIANYLIESMTIEHRTAFEEFLRNMVLHLPARDYIMRRTARVIRSLAWHGRAVIVGRGGVFLCADMANGLHLQLSAPVGWRVEQLARKQNISDIKDAERRIEKADRERKIFFEKHFKKDICRAHQFDLVINNSRFAADQIVELVVTAMLQRGLITKKK